MKQKQMSGITAIKLPCFGTKILRERKLGKLHRFMSAHEQQTFFKMDITIKKSIKTLGRELRVQHASRDRQQFQKP